MNRFLASIVKRGISNNKSFVKLSTLNSTKDKGAELGMVYGSSILNTTFPTIQALENSQNDAIHKMLKKAEDMNAEWIIGVRFKSGRISSGESQITVYGTALSKEDDFSLFF